MARRSEFARVCLLRVRWPENHCMSLFVLLPLRRGFLKAPAADVAERSFGCSRQRQFEFGKSACDGRAAFRNKHGWASRFRRGSLFPEILKTCLVSSSALCSCFRGVPVTREILSRRGSLDVLLISNWMRTLEARRVLRNPF